jgi:hypothetical protein
MRLTGTYDSEWVYLGAGPSLLRAVRIFIVGAAIGATAVLRCFYR